MLIIGSRALRRSFPDARCALDWDCVGTRAELAALSQRLEPLEGVPWSPRKAYFLKEDRPLEYIVADDSPWMDVLALPARQSHEHDLGSVAYASAETLLLLKLSHIHLSHHWRKTADDVGFLLPRAPLPSAHAALLEDLRRHAEARRGAGACSFGSPDRLLPDAPSAPAARRRDAMHAALGGAVKRHADPSRPDFAARLPQHPKEAARLLAEIAMAHASMHDLYPTFGIARVSAADERRALDSALETLCTDIFGRNVRIALAPHATAARALAPRAFSSRLAELMDRDSAAHGTSATRAFRPPPARPDLAIVSRYLP